MLFSGLAISVGAPLDAGEGLGHEGQWHDAHFVEICGLCCFPGLIPCAR